MTDYDLYKEHNVTPVIPHGLGRGVPNSKPTVRQLCLYIYIYIQSHIIGGESIASRAQIQIPRMLLRNF